MSTEVFQQPSGSSFASTDESADLSELLPSVLSVQNVRITPGHMLFENAYEGKSFTKQMIIQNCGKNSVCVRMDQPSSTTFELKSFKKGLHLSPGVRIIRTVKYTYRSSLGTLQGFTTLWINEKEVRYHFLVTMTKAILVIEPQIIDFGKMDAVNHATTRTFVIKNEGYRGTKFAIDLGRNFLELNVYPIKGIVPAKSSVTVTIEIVGTKDGDFVGEFWIKTIPPQRIVVQGCFIAPQLVVRQLISRLEFTYVDFRHTYYGSETSQVIMIKNFSSFNSMFCIMAMVNGITMTLEEARKIDDNYKNFKIIPNDGRMETNKGALIKLYFTPVHTGRTDKSYAIGFIKVIRMDCTNCQDRKIYDVPVPLAYTSLEKMLSSTSQEESFADVDDNLTDKSVLNIGHQEEEKISFEHSIKIILYGEKEIARLELKPTTLYLNELTLNQNYQRTLLVKNKSKNLPILVRYKKVAGYAVEPAEFQLKPEKCLEVLIKIKTLKLGELDRRITFDLLSPGRFPHNNVVKNVGSAFVMVYLNTSEVDKRTRLKKCGLCCDPVDEIKLGSEFPYRLTETELAIKMKNDDYYSAYIRNLNATKTTDNNLKDYFLTNTKLANLKCEDWSNKPMVPQSEGSFIPLPPKLLYNIKITPKSIRLNNVTSYTTVREFFEIENLNTFPIRVYVKSSKPFIVFDHNSRYVIPSSTKKKITFSFSTVSTGRYYINISVLINDATLYEVTTVAHVVPKTIHTDVDEVVFDVPGEKLKFIRLMNPLNAVASFKWNIPQGSFRVFPLEGEIKPEKSILCTVIVKKYPSESLSNVECLLNSESGHSKIVSLTSKNFLPSVAFDAYEINLGLIPLNLPIKKKIVMKNTSADRIYFNILEESLLPGITVEPVRGTLISTDNQVFIVNIHLNSVVEFQTLIVFLINDKVKYEIKLKGEVEYPRVETEPKHLLFRKIVPFSYDVLAFKIENKGETDIQVAFSQDLPEFVVTASEDDQSTHLREVALKKKQAKVLFLHFWPTYVSTFSLFMIFTVNGIVGTAHSNNQQIKESSASFVKSANKLDQTYSTVKVKAVLGVLNSPRITAKVTEKKLEFSDLYITFQYFGEGHYNNNTKSEFHVSNISKEVVSVCMRLDHIGRYFSLDRINEGSFQNHEVSVVLVLEPSERAVLEITYHPVDEGVHKCKIPILLRHYDKIYNFLNLQGTFCKPTITPTVQSLYFEPVPVKISNKMNVILKMKNHFDNCEILPDSGTCYVDFIFENGKKVQKGFSIIELSVIYQSERQQCFDADIVFKCTCDSSCSIPMYGLVENCLLTTHVFSQFLEDNSVADILTTPARPWWNFGNRPRILHLYPNLNQTCYPFFPLENDRSIYGTYMKKLKKTLENWVYSQAFYKKCYYKIPEGFSDFCPVVEKDPKPQSHFRQKKKVIEVPLLQLVVNFTGNEIKKQLKETPSDMSNASAWLSYISHTNSEILYYLRGFSVFIPHVKSKYLLNYDQYLLYQQTKHPTDKPMDEIRFYKLSKQCWIDLILQMIKTFVLFRIEKQDLGEVILSLSRHHQSIQKMASSLSRSSLEYLGENVLDIGIYGANEMYLISWLQNVYNGEKNSLWENVSEEKDIVFFDEDLRDGLVLGAVTAHFCPYIKKEIQDMFTNPDSTEEYYHNACVLIKTWKLLNLSYVIKPSQILIGGLVEMLLLVSYLYNVLPHFFPKESYTVEADLTQKNKISIELENLGHHLICYTVIFFGNETQLFSVPQRLIKIEPNKTRNVNINYHAKSVATKTVTVLFSGETPGYKYSKSIAITLQGKADVSYACMELPITLDLYRICQVKLTLQSPFKIKTSYSLLFGYKPPNQEENFVFPYEEVKVLRRIRQFLIDDDSFQFDENGICEKPVTFCCQEEGPSTVWFYFTNPEVGDWSLKVILTGRVIKSCYENIDVWIPKNYQNLKCRCKDKVTVETNCPKIIKVKLPMKNNKLWKARTDMMLYHTEDEEKEFWAEKLYSPAGVRLIRLIVNSETHPLSQRINDTYQYQLKGNKSIPFVTCPSITVRDVTSQDWFDLPIHLKKPGDLSGLNQCKFTLLSEDKRESRFYKLNFKSDVEDIQ